MAGQCSSGKDDRPWDGVISQYPRCDLVAASVAHIPGHDLRTVRVSARGPQAQHLPDPWRTGQPGAAADTAAKRMHLRGKDRGDHGFVDEPTKLFFLDVDGVADAMARQSRRRDPAHRRVAGRAMGIDLVRLVLLGGARACETSSERRTSAGPAKSSTAGCGCGSRSSPTGAERAEADALTKIAQGARPQARSSICAAVQPNYIERPLWVEHPDRDPLGDIPTIGWVKGEHEYLAVPDNLATGALGEGAGTQRRHRRPSRRRGGGARHRQRRLGALALMARYALC